MSKLLTSDDLQRFIERNRIEATILPMAGHTPTVSDAARELGVDTERIIKSLVFLNDGAPLLVVTNGLARVDRRRLAAYLDVGRKKVKFASAEQASALTGYVVGSMPPFGNRQRLRTLVDPAVTGLDTIYGGGGDINAMMRLTSEELIRVTGAEIQAISET
ncbi:MAG TPA: YbaK/EbsC family protein [Desulfosarcina sp.]|nr:YbaK/EbsC family protein [Desulfosarcina sp.]